MDIVLFLVNLLLAFLAFSLTRYILNACKVFSPIDVIVAIIVGILVFFENFAVRFM